MKWNRNVTFIDKFVFKSKIIAGVFIITVFCFTFLSLLLMTFVLAETLKERTI